MSIFSLFNQLDTRSLITNLVVTTLTVVVSVAALIYTTQVTGPLPIAVNQVSTEKLSTFDVQGETEIVTTPDQAVLSAGYTVGRASVEEAQDEANRVLNAITSNLKQLGIEADDIKTTNYNINPEYDYSLIREGTPSEERIIGYQVSSNLEIAVKDLDNVNQVIDIATAQGANQVGGIRFTMSPELQERLTRQAREEAIADAKDNAREIANLTGLKLGNIVNVIEQTGGVEQPYPAAFRSMALDVTEASAPTQVEPGSNTFTYSVVLSYQTL